MTTYLILDDGSSFLLDDSGDMELSGVYSLILLPPPILQTENDYIFLTENGDYLLLNDGISATIQGQSSENISLTPHYVNSFISNVAMMVEYTETEKTHVSNVATMVEYTETEKTHVSNIAIMVEYNYDVTLSDIQNSTQSQTVDNITIIYHEEANPIVVENASQLQTSDNIELTQNYRYFLSLTYCSWFLLEDGSYFALEDDWRALNEDAIPGSCQLQASDNVELIQHYILELTLAGSSYIFSEDGEYLFSEDAEYLFTEDKEAGAAQTQTCNNVTLTYHESIPGIIVENANQAQNSDNINLITGYLLIINDSYQAQISDNILLTQNYIIQVANPSQLQIVDNVSLTQHYVLQIADSSQLQTADNISLTQHYALQIWNADQLQTADNISLTQHHTLQIGNADQLQIADNISLTQHYVLQIGNVDQLQISDNILLIQYYVYILQIENTNQLQTVDNISLTQHHVLQIENIAQLQLSDNISLTQHHILSVQGSDQIQFSENIDLVYHTSESIYVNNSVQLQISDNIILTQHHVLSVQNSDQIQTSDNINLAQNYILAVQNSSQTQISDNIILVQHYGLSIYNSDHYMITCEVSEIASDYILTEQYFGTDGFPTLYFPFGASSNIILIQHAVLVIHDSAHAQFSDNIILIQNYVLTTQDCVHIQISDNIQLSQGYTLSVQNTNQLQNSDNIELSSHYAIIIDNATQLQNSDNTVLTQHYSITIQNTAQIQITDNIELTQHQILSIQDVTQLQTSENIELIQGQTIYVENTTQLQTSENIELIQHQILSIQGATQLQTSENIELIQNQILSTQDTAQLQNSDNVLLVQHYSLTIDNPVQIQTSDNIILIQHYILYIDDTIQLQESSNIIFGGIVEDSLQLQISDNIDLVQHHILFIYDTIQIQNSDNIALTYAPPNWDIITDNANHIQIANNIGLVQNYALSVNNATQLQIITEYFTFIDGYGGSKTTYKDTFIVEIYPTTNYGTNTTLQPHNYSVGDTRNVLIQFDVSSLTGMTVLTATLTLYKITYRGAYDLGIYRLIQSWTETGATWNKRDTTNNWSTPGAQGSGTDRISTATQIVTCADSNLIYNNLRSDVQAWIDGASNYGWVIDPTTPPNTQFNDYGSSDNSTTGLRPKLEVVYYIALNLTQHQVLAPDNSIQIQTPDNIDLTWRFATLTVQDTTQTQTAEEPILITSIYIVLTNNCIQLQSADNLRLETNIYSLVVYDSYQSQISEKIELFAHYVLTLVNNTSHVQTSQKIILFIYITGKVYTRVGSFNIDTSKTVGQNQTITGIGFTPKLVIFWCSGGSATGNDVSGGTFNIVFGAATDALNRFCVGSISEDAQGTSDNYHWTYGSLIIRIDTQVGAPNGLLDFASMDFDGFTVQIDDQFSFPYKINYMALGGTEFTPKIGNGTFRTTVGNKSYTGVGFKPDALIFASAFNSSIPAGTIHTYLSLGMTSGSNNQGTTAIVGIDNVGITDTRSYGYNGECLSFAANIGNASYRSSLVSMDTDGFTLSMTDPGSAMYFYYIALKGGNYKVGDINTRTDRNNIVETIGFNPSGLLMFSNNRILSTVDQPTANGAISIGAADYLENNVAAGIWEENGLDVSENAYANYNSDIYVNVAHDAIQGRMYIKSFEIDGFTALMNVTDITENWVTYLAIGEPPVFLPVHDAVQIQTAEEPVLFYLPNPIAVHDSFQIQIVDNIDLVQHHVLEIQDIIQIQISDNPHITTDIVILRMKDSLQLQTSDIIPFIPMVIFAYRKISFGIGKKTPGV